MNNLFAPLSTQELTAVPAPVYGHDDTTSCDKGFSLVAPIPDNHPPVPEYHKLGKPTKSWTYRSASAEVLFIACRFDPPGQRKAVLPLTLWRDRDGNFVWQWKGFPTPLPLYNLECLAGKPDAPVIVVEGEKCSDAASEIFLDCVCTTSPGGAAAANKTDWTPLSGRDVTVWPDADKPGEKYAKDVADILLKLGCRVRVVDQTALASMTPGGAAREAPDGWDAGDALDEWQDLPALRNAVHGHAKPIGNGPAYISWGDYRMDERGLWVDVTNGRGNTATVTTEWVSGAFEVLGATRDPQGCGWGKWLRWSDADGRVHVRHIADSALHSDPAALAASLACEGLRIDRGRQRLLASYLCGVQTDGRVTMVPRTGWHIINGHNVFVLPNETIGPDDCETVILDTAAAGPYEARGSLVDWQEGVGFLVADHALSVLAVAAALSGPLLRLSGQGGGGLNFFGPSSKGKTTILQAAASVWGRGGSPGYARSWRATGNGLEGAAASTTDTCLALDELGVVEARDAAAAIYGLSNGTGKARAARVGSLREPKSLRVLLLSTGGIPIATKLSEDRGRRQMAGQAVRMLDIPADRGFGFGAFDNAGPDGDAAKLSGAIKQAAIAAYGTAGPAFVRRLIDEKVSGDDIRAMVSEFVENEVPPGADGQVVRAAERLALIAAAGTLAVAMDIAPWPPGAAREAAQWAFQQWVAQRGGTDPHEARQAIMQVRLVIEQHGSSRFEVVGDPDAKAVLNRLGWRKGDGAEREWWVPSEVWRTDVCCGMDPLFVAKVLVDRGMLRVQGGRGYQCKVNIGGDRRVNCYALTAAVLDGGDDAS